MSPRCARLGSEIDTLRHNSRAAGSGGHGVAAATERLRAAEAERDSLRDRRDRLERELSDARSECESLRSRAEALRAELAAAHAACDGVRTELAVEKAKPAEAPDEPVIEVRGARARGAPAPGGRGDEENIESADAARSDALEARILQEREQLAKAKALVRRQKQHLWR